MRSKNYGINVRVTEQEKQKLLENARFCSLSLSEYLRRLGLGKEVRAAITERDYRLFRMLNGLKNKLCCVRGNCEAEVDQMVLDFPVMADYCILPAGEKLIYATHGHIYNGKNPPPLAEGDILLHGHTHVPAWTEFGQRNVCLNPGSLSIPKENSPHSYMILENGVFYWKDVETGEIYHTRVL